MLKYSEFQDNSFLFITFIFHKCPMSVTEYPHSHENGTALAFQLKLARYAHQLVLLCVWTELQAYA